MHRSTAALILTLPLLIAACHDSEPRVVDDQKAIAMVEAAQNVAPPPTPIEPQPITAADIEKNGLYGAGCSLVPSSQPGGDPVVMVTDRRALVKLGGRFITFAADVGSATVTAGIRSHYVGKAQSLWVEKGTGDGIHLGQDAMRWDGRVTVRDAHDQLVYTMTGELVCSA